MKFFDAGVIKELVFGSIGAAVCFGAPVFMKLIFPEPTAIHGVVNDMPFLGSLIIGLTVIRLWHRKKNFEEDVSNR